MLAWCKARDPSRWSTSTNITWPDILAISGSSDGVFAAAQLADAEVTLRNLFRLARYRAQPFARLRKCSKFSNISNIRQDRPRIVRHISWPRDERSALSSKLTETTSLIGGPHANASPRPARMQNCDKLKGFVKRTTRMRNRAWPGAVRHRGDVAPLEIRIS